MSLLMMFRPYRWWDNASGDDSRVDFPTHTPSTSEVVIAPPKPKLVKKPKRVVDKILPPLPQAEIVNYTEPFAISILGKAVIGQVKRTYDIISDPFTITLVPGYIETENLYSQELLQDLSLLLASYPNLYQWTVTKT